MITGDRARPYSVLLYTDKNHVVSVSIRMHVIMDFIREMQLLMTDFLNYFKLMVTNWNEHDSRHITASVHTNK